MQLLFSSIKHLGIYGLAGCEAVEWEIPWGENTKRMTRIVKLCN